MTPPIALGRLREEANRELDRLHKAGLERRLLGRQGVVDLVTNDYLSLRADERVKQAAADALIINGLGAGASRLLGGDFPAHRKLEEAFSAWQGTGGAVLFPTGTAANQGALGALLSKEDLAVSDAENHASLVDGVRLSGCRKIIVPHGVPEAVEEALRRDSGTGQRFVIVEGIHGMNGSLAPLNHLADICRRRQALLIVDEAHAIGIAGPDGAGAVAAAGCEDVVACRVNPCGKALGGAGGVVTASETIVNLIIAKSRALHFTTGLPPCIAAGLVEAIRIAREESWRRDRATGLAKEFAASLRDRGWSIPEIHGAFVPWIVRSKEASVAIASDLRREGFCAWPIRPPTVPEGTSRLRLTFHALGLDSLDALAACVPESAAAAR